ncbi:MAG: hypothetical protein E6772_17610 [Dysgonomonas sp.]|nr:hypothetical protein [Dysgonomonas sp.]
MIVFVIQYMIGMLLSGIIVMAIILRMFLIFLDEDADEMDDSFGEIESVR